MTSNKQIFNVTTKYVFFFLVSLSLLQAEPRYTRDDTKEIVTDNYTNLMWQDNISNVDQYVWDNGLSYCRNLNFGGYTDWYLPNLNELNSIIDRTNTPATDIIFVSNNEWDYWSSSTYADTSGNLNAYKINTYNGLIQTYSKNQTRFARCARIND